MAKTTVFKLPDSSKLISRKICVTGKILGFPRRVWNTVYDL